MKKRFFVYLCILLMLSALSVALSSCLFSHTHKFDQQVVENKYLATFADYENAATYYYSCVCEEKGAKTFTYGDPLIPSEGLAYTLNEDGESYSVIGIATSVDNDIVIAPTYNGKPVTAIGEEAFDDCEHLASVAIPDSVTSIGDSAFSGCSGLENVVIPDSVTKIGESAFSGCSRIKIVVIGDSVTEIGESAFSFCSNLMCMVVSDVTALIRTEEHPDHVIKEIGITIPDNVTSIGDFVFSGCTDIENVMIPDNVTSIGESAFNRCSRLTSITVSENNSYYQGINGNLYTKDGNTLVKYAIGKTDTSFTVPAGVKTIGNFAFEFCHNLTTIAISDSVNSIGIFAFSFCENLTNIVIPDNVTSIGESAFNSCSGLTSISVSKNNPSYKDIDGNLYTKDGKTLIQYTIGKTNTSFTVPDGVETISDFAFEFCRNLTAITISDSVTSIKVYAFVGCNSLTDIVIGTGLTKIGGWIGQCDNLTNIKYRGTEAEWKTVTENFAWFDGTKKYTITYNYTGE